MVHNRLIKRQERNIELVQAERERLKKVYAEEDNSATGARGREEADSRNEKFREAELDRIDRLRLKNKREAERLIYEMYCGLEIQQEEEERRRKAAEDKARCEEEQRLKRKADVQLALARERQLEEQERQRQMEVARAYEIQQQHQLEVEARRMAMDELRQREFEELDRERRRINARAAQIAKETEERRDAEYLEASRRQEELDREFAERKKEMQRQREEDNRRREEAKQRQVEAIKRQRLAIIEGKRVKTEQRMRKQEEAYEMLRQQREQELEDFSQRQQEKFDEAERARRKMDKRREEAGEQLLQTERERLQDFYERKEETQAKSQQQAVQGAMSDDEHVAAAARIAAATEAKAVENAYDYEKKMRRIALLQEARQKQAYEADLIRKSLEREKSKVMAGALTSKDIGKKNPKQLRDLADQLGIDLAALKEKAKMTRRGKGSATTQTLPKLS
jgi:hypothetical protein